MIKVNDLVLYEVDALYTDPMTFERKVVHQRALALVIDTNHFYKIFVNGRILNVTSISLKEFE